jgi:hypothetical protein
MWINDGAIGLLLLLLSKSDNVSHSRVEEEQDSVDDLIGGSDSDGEVQVLQVMKVPATFF